MTGLIWFVQVVHYPLFQGVGQEQFIAYEQAHTRLTTWVVAPVMVMELVLAIGLAVFQLDWFWGIQLGMVILIWASTFLIQVPLHGKLASGYKQEDAQNLVQTNWIRTFFWTLKGLLLLAWPQFVG